LSDLGGAESKTSISLKETEYSLKQFAKSMGQPNISTFNKWKNVWVPGFVGKKHRSVIQGQTHLKQLHDGPLQWEAVGANILDPFETWLPLDNVDTAEWIQ
jgi:hypothetical protein